MKDAAAVHAMYDALAWYVQLENWRARGSRFADFSLHKSLAVDAGAAPYAPTAFVNELIVREGGIPQAPHVLDAGCGFGGTIFHLHERLGGTYDGITLSRPQLRAARRQARRRGIEGACRFHRRSYDEPQPGTYDAVVAVESLSHARDLGATLAGLARALRPGGRMVLVEDMVANDIEATFPREAAALREHWGCVRFPRVGDYEQALRQGGMRAIRRIDLTPRVRYRPVAELDRVGAVYARWFKRLPLAPARRVLSAYIGGIALEKLYAAGEARYRLIVAARDGESASAADGAACQDYSARAIPR